MRAKKEGSTQSRVLELLKLNKEISIKELQVVLDFYGPRGWARISNAIQSLLKAGYVERVSRGTYCYKGELKDLDYCKGQNRMARVMKIKTKQMEPFTVRKIAELSDCSLNWAKRYIKFLLTKVYLKRVGFARARFTRVPIYLATDDKLYEDWPAMRRHRKTSETDKAVTSIRETAYKVGRDLQTNRESLTKAIDDTRNMLDMLNETLANMDKF